MRHRTTPLETGEMTTVPRWLWSWSQSSDVFSIRKGVLWLLLATVAEVPPAVCPAILLYTQFLLTTM